MTTSSSPRMEIGFDIFLVLLTFTITPFNLVHIQDEDDVIRSLFRLLVLVESDLTNLLFLSFRNNRVQFFIWIENCR